MELERDTVKRHELKNGWMVEVTHDAGEVSWTLLGPQMLGGRQILAEIYDLATLGLVLRGLLDAYEWERKLGELAS